MIGQAYLEGFTSGRERQRKEVERTQAMNDREIASGVGCGNECRRRRTGKAGGRVEVESEGAASQEDEDGVRREGRRRRRRSG